MTLHTPLLIGPTGADPTINVTQQEFRNFTDSLLRTMTSVSHVRGVIGGTGAFLVTQRGAGANFSVDVATGRAYIFDGDITDGGTYWVWSDAVVNVAVPSPPGSGTRVHRVVLQLRNKGENGAWGTYDFIPLLLPDIGSGTPAEPASAITLALVSVTVGQASVLNANITDYRERADLLTVNKAGTTGPRTSNSQIDDPDLQLTNLAANAFYEVSGLIIFDAVAASFGGITFTWRQPGGQTFFYTTHLPTVVGGSLGSGGIMNGSTDLNIGSATVTKLSGGTGVQVAIPILGQIDTAAAPAYLVFQWGSFNGSGACNVDPHSFLKAQRIG